jgi:pyrroline-5-carboxylate reductase
MTSSDSVGAEGTIGILGAGHFGTALIEGFLASMEPSRLMIVGRGEPTSRLCARLGVTQVPDPERLLDCCSTVVLAVRSEQAVESVTGLRWREDHLLLSVCAGVPLQRLEAACAPATAVRALPLITATIGRSPTTLFPDNPRARALLERLGSVMTLDSEAGFEVAAAAACTFVWAYALVEITSEWARDNGLDITTARRLVAACIGGAGAMIERDAGQPVGPMLAAMATPGGLSAEGMRRLNDAGIGDHWRHALDGALDRARLLD